MPVAPPPPHSEPARVPAPPPPPSDLPPALSAKLLGLARDAPGGWAARGRWLAITRFDEPWTTALVHLVGVPGEAVWETAACAEYARALHGLLLHSYAARGLTLPPWRSWATILRRWPPLADHRPAPARVHVLRPMTDDLPRPPLLARLHTRPIPIRDRRCYRC